MRKQADGKVRRSVEEWRQIMDRYRASGESGAAFCRKNKIPKSSFEKWKKKIGQRTKVTRKVPSFVEWPVPVPPKPRDPGPDRSSGEFELSLPGGIVLRWRP